MNLAVAYHNGARDQVIRWMNWVLELGGLGSHKLFTMPAFDCEPVPDILPSTRLKDEEQIVSDWQSTQPARSAAAPNSMFRQFAWHFYLQKLGPWLFIEPDCVPLRKGWLDELSDEYYSYGQPLFMGAHVQIERVPEHMSGNGIYPQDTPALAPTIVMHTNWVTEGREYELAFDIAGAREVLPQAHFTNLIQHVFRHKGFKTRAEFDALIDPSAVVFHSNKSGDIYPYIKENVFGTPSAKPELPEKYTSGVNGGICSVNECGKPAHARGVCRMHYARLEKHGSFDLPPKPSLDERLAFSRTVSDSGCWLWTEGTNKAGYGQIYIDSVIPKMVHRVSYEHFIGPIPDGLYVCHKCDVPGCFNPEHLFTGTNSENQLDASRKGRLKGRRVHRGKATGARLEQLRANLAKARAAKKAKSMKQLDDL